MKRTGEENRTKDEKVIRKSLSKTTIAFIVLFVLGVIGIVFVIIFVNKATGLVLQEDTYQYFRNSYIEHKTGTSLTNSEMSTILIEDKKEASVDDTPMYSNDGNSIYLPESYIYCSTDDNSYWRIPEFMKLTRNSANELIKCTFNDDYYEIKHGFLVDSGNRNYVFLDTGDVIINDLNKYPVTIFSFFSMDYDVYRIYDHSSGEIVSLDKIVGNDRITNIRFVSASGYSVDLYKGSYTNVKGELSILSASPSLLPSISER